MRNASKIFYGITVFMAVMAIIYIVTTMHLNDSGNIRGLEWAGATGLALSAGLALMLGAYFHFTERRMDILPQDWEEAEVEDGSGMLGFFSPSSIWPFAMTCAIAVLGYGIVFMAYWLIAIGAVLLILFATLLNLQYGIPREKH
ncbi:aa3-type cytochrome oxidase subunit IV [Corynebacterium sp. TAE3-ERU16]|uniref:aa3-type cytochrome oxidase subunit IV n=1 Tax=Corynebacterium sp. TAE3-ERU16 TaxID=2849493 RepID=UPI001C48C27F|nr:cytochrome c oxidase subunit 4 [Corynebacterium sp. TAE3-ERU16]MBV7292129.1 cytochrome c oxidase subunit 4 [Corynebacterium sp. TAE3-ERU16]